MLGEPYFASFCCCCDLLLLVVLLSAILLSVVLLVAFKLVELVSVCCLSTNICYKYCIVPMQ